MLSVTSRRARIFLAALAVILATTAVGTTVAAARVGYLVPESGDPRFSPDAVGGELERGLGEVLRPEVTAPPLTEEQERLLGLMRELVVELETHLDQIMAASAGNRPEEVRDGFLAYISTMTELDQAVHAFMQTFPQDRPIPVRLVVGILGELREHVHGLSVAWVALPETYRAPVAEALRAAVSASPHPRLWGALIAAVGRQAADPAKIRERIEQALARLEADLEFALRRIDALQRRIAILDEQIERCTDERRLAALTGLRRLAELDLKVQEAKVARDEFGLEHLRQLLERLDDLGG